MAMPKVLRDLKEIKDESITATSATLSGSAIVLTVPVDVSTGSIVKFTAPCDCSAAASGIKIGDSTYSLVNAKGEAPKDAWVSGALISVLLDCTGNRAYIINGAVDSFKKREMTQADYDALVESGEVDENTFYIIIDAEATGGSVKADEVYITIPTNWTTRADGTYTTTVSVAGVTGEKSQPIFIDMNLSGTDINADIAVMEAWGCVNRIDPVVGALKFVCYETAPTVNIPLNVVVM